MASYDWKKAVSLGMLRGVAGWPCPEMPEWANTAAVRMKDMGVDGIRIKQVIADMEIVRRKKARESVHAAITEFDAGLADFLEMFEVKGNANY